ncbi:hypothetical protein ACFQ1L_02625 [Phytohabitans flavus]|uniref:hypothetical protein n=1 Tax=Phytohabitans flavus TaxID=1076124 RepID=UPI001563DFB9|nr:hypothetical protein [Phytohabitans flavus]
MDRVPARGAGSLDAIVVPTARGAVTLREAILLGLKVGCPVVALCSQAARASEATELGQSLGATVLAIDCDDVRAIPGFATEALLEEAGMGSVVDLSLKRNLGLLLARIAGWERILFLDDDIFGVNPDDLGGAASLLDNYRAVGLENFGYEDNSVVCHAYRAVDGEQDTFIGGGAMLVAPKNTRSFFPNIYNEDWFFLLGDGVPFKVAVTGRAVQKEYDPFATPERAAREELGDSLAEGIYWLLDNGLGPEHADSVFWADFLYRRRRLLDDVLARSESRIADPVKREKVQASLRAAKGASSFITPKICREYVAAWRKDLDLWGEHLDTFRDQPSVDKALSELGLFHRAHRSEYADALFAIR